MNFSNYIWALYLIIFPFYLLKEGDPQIADALGALLIAINSKSIVLSIKKNGFSKLLFLFICYTFLVNTIWMLILRDTLVLKNSVYYLYSFFIFLFITSRIEEHKFLNFTLNCIGISLIVQLILWPLIPSQGVRTQLFFHNPNQLAQWALCLLIISNVIAHITKTKFYYILIISLLCSFFVLISASRAATAGIVIFWFFFLIKKKKQMIIFVFGIILIVSALIISEKLSIKASDFNTINYVIERITTRNSTYNQGLEGRGFERIYNYPQYIFFGAGEGQVERFNARVELHSTLFNILFCYGIIGFILFLAALWLIFRDLNKDVLVLLVMISLYMHVHMTLRIPLIWITLLFLYYLNESINESKIVELNYK